MTRRVELAAALGCVVAAAAVVTAQQRFTARAEAVRVDVLVTSGNTLVSGLTAKDFEVRDSGVVQRIEQIDVEQLPLNLILVLDTSGSVAGQRLQHLLEAGRSLLEGLREHDRVALVSFAARVRLLAPLTPGRYQIRAAFDGLKGAGTTSLRDAAFAALALREADPGRTLMLLFSDGADTSSWLTATKVIDTATRTDVVVYPVGTREQMPIRLRGEFTNKKDIEQSGKFLDALADATGGRVMMAGGDADLRATFVKTLAEFRDRYVLYYQPAGVAPGGWHPLQVRLKGKSGKVTARRGYFAQ